MKRTGFSGDHFLFLDIKTSVSRRGNCWDTTVAESFCGNLKKEKKPKTAITKPGRWAASRLRIDRTFFTFLDAAIRTTIAWRLQCMSCCMLCRKEVSDCQELSSFCSPLVKRCHQSVNSSLCGNRQGYWSHYFSQKSGVVIIFGDE